MSKAFDICKRLIAGLYILILAFLVIDLFICQNFLDWHYRKEFALPNILLLLIGVAVVALLSFIALRYYKLIQNKADKFINRISIGVLALVLFFIQLYISKNIYFVTGWDAGTVTNSALSIAENRGNDLSWYYDIYPNNIFITYLFAAVIKLNMWLGLFADSYFALIAFQCLISAITAYLVYTVTYEFTKHKLISLFAFWVYSLFIGLSPWFVIPYSDATGILFPILILRIYQMTRKERPLWQSLTLWGLIGFSAFIGFRIKPQIVIIFIAVVILTFAEMFFKKLKDKRKFFMYLLQIGICFAVFITSAFGFALFVKGQDNLSSNPNKEIVTTHYVMMGLNNNTDGGYWHPDYEYTRSFETKDERKQANIEEIKRRIEEYGFGGLTEHVLKKTLVNFGDGTFAWSKEGSFYQVLQPEPNDTIAPKLRSFYYSDGDNYIAFNTYMQCIWLTVLCLGVFTAIKAIRKGNDSDSAISVLLLGLIGLTLFETLFEARARYLFSYAPLFIVCAVVGLYALLKSLNCNNKEITNK